MTGQRGMRRVAVLGIAVAMAAGCGGGPETPVAQPGAATGTPALPSVTPRFTGAPTPAAPPAGSAGPSTPASTSMPGGTAAPSGIPAPSGTLASSAIPAPTGTIAPSGIPAPGQTVVPAPGVTPSGIPTAGKDGVLKRGESGPEVVALQRRLDALGYWNGPADGRFGALTLQAVYAVQKAAGIERTGRADDETLAALAGGVRPAARSRKGHRVEIDLDRQLLMMVDDGAVTRILNTSTGSNEHYHYQGRRYLADTPAGKFRVGRQIDDWRYGPLGPLYRPKYFNGGVAVHGATSIPPYPASHGCARLSIAAMDWVWKSGEMPVGTPIWVY
ncbi:hypothetical protein J2S43_002805 [Catenuloplanes nepalensis]|uniref:L,D-TPase catalytic domain-containing protein n=1 Tax=Catenuloplanes nepalensis TaxID=587533 RepID=A0ABT9MSD4_9ACTN|nr:peptidoglycan-binding protein [Catenuloplanes nepalensis]MDP9794293.1 hypothetical protein [Catenuloplanes nepalensis]